MIQSTLVSEPGTPGTIKQDQTDTPLLDEQQAEQVDVVDHEHEHEHEQTEEQTVEPTNEPSHEQIVAEKEHRMLEDLQHYRKDLQHQAEIVSRRKSAWEESKIETADMKKSYEAAMEQLHEMAMKDVTLPLFNQPDDEDIFNQQSDTAAPQSPEADEDESWRDTPLDDLGITGKLAEKLIEAELTTLGQISDYTSAGKQLTDIAGVGPGNANKIADACADYWVQHPQPTEASDTAQSPEADEDLDDQDGDVDEDADELDDKQG